MRKITFSEGEFYHLYNRGVDKRTIFSNRPEYRRFIAYLYLLNSRESIRPAHLLDMHGVEESLTMDRGEPLVALGAYCLMPNHIHLLVTPLVENGISKYMQRVQTAYTMYFNERHERSGALFQGTFKAEHADQDEYAKYLFSYIHLNPAKIVDPAWRTFGPSSFAKVKKFVSEYPYSSIGEYLSRSHVLTDPSRFPDYLSDFADIENHIDFWLRFRDERGEAKPHIPV